MRALLRPLRHTVLVAAIACTSAAHSQDPLVQELILLLGRGQHIEATLKLLEHRGNSPGLLAWIEAMAKLGVVPFAYEAARRSPDRDSAIRWYAVGYVGQSAVMSECADRGPNPKAIFLSATYGSIGRMARESNAQFVPALERALAMEYMGTFRNHGAEWLCEETIPDGRKRAAARNDQAVKLRAEIDELKRKLDSK